MVQSKKGTFSEFLKSQVELVQSRIGEFQREADKFAAELSSRGQAQLKEMEKLVQKLDTSPLADRSAEIVDRAKVFGGEFIHHFEDLHGKLADFVGVATHEQVSEIAKEIKGLSKKIDGLTKGARSKARI